MLAVYLLQALRRLLRRDREALLQTGSLAVGLLSFVLLSVYLWHQMSYDRSHADADHKYRLIYEVQYEGKLQPFKATGTALAPYLAGSGHPFTGFTRALGGGKAFPARINGQREALKQAAFVDPNFLQYFDLPLQVGNAATALADRSGMVLGADDATRLYGSPAAALGQTIDTDYGMFKVTGVLADHLPATHLRFRTLLPIAARGEELKDLDAQVYTLLTESYVTIAPGTDPAEAQKALSRMVAQHLPKESGLKVEVYLQPLSAIHLGVGQTRDMPTDSSILYVQILLAVGLILLLAAMANYVLLSVVSLTGRYREVGVRKVLGADRGQLVLQLLAQNGVQMLVALLLVLGALPMVRGAYTELAGVDPVQVFFASLPYQLALGGLVLGLVVVGTGYPAWALSRLQPAAALKGGGQGTGMWRRYSAAAVLRNTTVVTQIAISSGLLVATLVANRQMTLMLEADPGFNTEGLYTLDLPNDTTARKAIPQLAAWLKGRSEVAGVSVASYLPGMGADENAVQIGQNGKKELLGMRTIMVDEHYLATVGVPLVQGRNFERRQMYPTQGYIINETAAKRLGFDQPVGKVISFMGDAPILGVVKDYHFAPMQEAIVPLVLAYSPADYTRYLLVKMQPGMESRAPQLLEQAVKATTGMYPYTAAALEERMTNVYKDERVLERLLTLFTGVALVLSLVGVVALCSYQVTRRQREIGIRKVLGASPVQLIRAVFSQLGLLAVGAFLLALPVAWLGMGRWLEQFALRTELGAGVALTAFGALGVLLLAVVGWQAVRVLRIAPTEVMRGE